MLGGLVSCPIDSIIACDCLQDLGERLAFDERSDESNSQETDTPLESCQETTFALSERAKKVHFVPSVDKTDTGRTASFGSTICQESSPQMETISKMAKREKIPWKRSQCKPLCEESATHCASCGAAADQSFVAKEHARSNSPRTQPYHPWGWDASSGWGSSSWQWDYGRAPPTEKSTEAWRGKRQRAQRSIQARRSKRDMAFANLAFAPFNSSIKFAVTATTPETTQAPVVPP